VDGQGVILQLGGLGVWLTPHRKKKLVTKTSKELPTWMDSLEAGHVARIGGKRGTLIDYWWTKEKFTKRKIWKLLNKDIC
jgi:hypothetical protein